MTEAQCEEVALFRFGVISDLVGATRLDYGETERLIMQKSAQRWSIPHSNRTRISASTIRRWVRNYEKSGRQLSALAPAGRSDQGKSRRVDDETILALVKLRKQKPTLPVNRLVAEMEEKELISPGIILTPSTVYRILKNEGVGCRQRGDKTDRRKFEAEFPNDIWQSDVMHGPSVEVDGKKRKTYLIACIDDHSRLLPHAEFYLSERLACWLDLFRQALLTRGLPRKLYVDNGAAFRTRHLERVCASLGIALVHTPPYTPQGRGKIERFFRTVRTQFLPGFRGGELAELNVAFSLWVNDDYHRRVHSGTGEPPLNRFARHIELIRTAPVDLEDHFRKEVRRRVAKDRTVSIDGRLFEAPTMLIGEHIQLLFHEQTPDRVQIFHKGICYGFLLPVNLKVNCRVKREKNGDRLVVAAQHTPMPTQGRLPFTGGSRR
ncbi:MAG: DDE-type integrase/transposase/recombinase [Gammaproteobacteria bacterium]